MEPSELSHADYNLILILEIAVDYWSFLISICLLCNSQRMRANDIQGWIILHHKSLPSLSSTVPTDPKLLFRNNIEFRSKDPTGIGAHASHCKVNPSHHKSLLLIEEWSNTMSRNIATKVND